MGLWDLRAGEGNTLTRKICRPVMDALVHAQRLEEIYRVQQECSGE